VRRLQGRTEAFTAWRSVRAAYRLAELYAQAGRAKDCVKMLKRLEEDDDSLTSRKRAETSARWSYVSRHNPHPTESTALHLPPEQS
jgi:hypothetical protein